MWCTPTVSIEHLCHKKRSRYYRHFTNIINLTKNTLKVMNIISILAYSGIGLDWRKVSGSPPSRRGQCFLPEDLPKEERSFLASFLGVLTKVVSSSSPQLYSSNVSSKSGLASELLKILKLSSELNRDHSTFRPFKLV